MKIEVEWVCTPTSGITEIELSELNCETIEEWNALKEPDKIQRLSETIEEHDLSSVKFTPKSWEITD